MEMLADSLGLEIFQAYIRMNFHVGFSSQVSEAAPGLEGLAGFFGSEEDH